MPGRGGGETTDNEGKIIGASNKGSDIGTIAKSAGAGAGIGGLATQSAKGVGIGAGSGSGGRAGGGVADARTRSGIAARVDGGGGHFTVRSCWMRTKCNSPGRGRRRLWPGRRTANRCAAQIPSKFRWREVLRSGGNASAEALTRVLEVVAANRQRRKIFRGRNSFFLPRSSHKLILQSPARAGFRSGSARWRSTNLEYPSAR